MVVMRLRKIITITGCRRCIRDATRLWLEEFGGGLNVEGEHESAVNGIEETHSSCKNDQLGHTISHTGNTDQ